MFQKFLDTARKKLVEWEDVQVVANTIRRRIFELEVEIEALKECRCGREAHEQFAPRIRL